MSLFIDFLKNRSASEAKKGWFDAINDNTAERLPYFESFIDLLEEAGLKESEETKDDWKIFNFKYKNEVWVSLRIKGSHIDMDFPITTKIFENEDCVKSPYHCIAIAYNYLRNRCVNRCETGEAIVSLGFMISSYMTHITNGEFRSKRIQWKKDNIEKPKKVIEKDYSNKKKLKGLFL